MSSLLEQLQQHFPACSGFKFQDGLWGKESENLYELIFEGRLLGQAWCREPTWSHQRHLEHVYLGANQEEDLVRHLNVLSWVNAAKLLAPEVCQWIGIYYKASYLLNEKNTDLVLGPFLGAPTDHRRIPLDRGICGLALREEKVINIKDVKSDKRYLACSLETQSELVIPLMDRHGKFVAELDIDCHHKAGFSSAIEHQLREFAFSFETCLV